MREEAGYTAAEAGKALGWSSGRLNHLEGGRLNRPDPSALRDLMRLYGADKTTEEAILSLGRQSREKGWWVNFSEVISDDYIGFEAEADHVHVYQPVVIPGLLQTPAYARASARAALAVREEDITKIVEAREERQKLLEGDGLAVSAVIDETALIRLLDLPDVARGQLQRLLDLAEELNQVSIQVLPLKAGLHASMGAGFVILDYADERDPTLVYLEGRQSSQFLEEPGQVADFRRVFTSLMRQALSEAETIRLIKRLLSGDSDAVP